ncbi:MAG TPA: hypothetical protein VEW42_03405 [Candidatus Eisenbacteria bacterium]|nr:hypothetical protein [Candidatus Eisenbacteria bacterium]
MVMRVLEALARVVTRKPSAAENRNAALISLLSSKTDEPTTMRRLLVLGEPRPVNRRGVTLYGAQYSED